MISADLSSVTVPRQITPADYITAKVTDGRDTVEVVTETWNDLMDRLAEFQTVADANPDLFRKRFLP